MNSEDLVGKTIRDYEIRALLGAGGFARVYEAYHPATQRAVAFKHILTEHSVKPTFIQRFDLEASMVAELKHPHIVEVYDLWRDSTGIYFVMQLITGGNLRKLIRTHGAVPPPRAATILDQVASALDLAHQHEIIHRDVKPDNILLDEQGDAHLGDFDIARSLKRIMRITGTDAVVGTMTYAAPEQISKEGLSPETDVYALGVTLYEMLAGAYPYGSGGNLGVLLKRLREPFPLIREKMPDLPSAVDDVIQKATAKAPQERYARASEMAAAFRKAIS
jgi:eukaryotic-like serine/threonine-protein kinase